MVLHDSLGDVQGAGRLVKAVRWLTAVALTVIAVGAVAFTLEARRGSAGPSVPAKSLSWRAIRLEGVQLALPRFPTAILYILPSCAHCAAGVKAFVSDTRARSISGLVIAGSGAGDVRDYQQRLGLRDPIAVDSARAFARSAGIEWVPSLVVLQADSLVRVFPIPAPALVRRHLEKLR